MNYIKKKIENIKKNPQNQKEIKEEIYEDNYSPLIGKEKLMQEQQE